MASSGSKKGKKNKGKVIPLQSFLSTNDTPIGTAQVTKKIRNYDGDDSDDSGAVIPLVYQLPTAPRAHRIFNDTSIPHTPPFIAYITNLPFDFTENDLYEYFEAYNLVSVRLPRDENDTSNRGRGSASVELETRDDLIDVLSLPDPYIKGRRVRIDATNEQEHYGKGSGGGGHRSGGGGHHRRGFDNFGNSNHNSDNRESSSSSNWRDNNNKPQDNYSKDNYNRDNRDRNISRDTNSPGSWRKGDRPSATHFSYHNRDNRDNNRESYKQNDDKLQERPKLNLKPRTLPLPEIVTKPLEIENKSSTIDGGSSSGNGIGSGTGSGSSSTSGHGVSAEKVFGDAKPVDTTARDLEIEERLAESRRQEQQALLQKSEQDETNDVTQKMKELNVEKSGKESTENSHKPQTNWRIKTDTSTEKYFDKNGDNKRRGGDLHYRDSNRFNRERERNERSQNRNRSNNKDHSTDGRQKYESKRLDNHNKTNRTVTKNISSSQQQEPIIKSSNMYSGLDDEVSD